LFFKFGDLDATKPSASIKIRNETIVHYLAKYSPQIIRRKLAALPVRVCEPARSERWGSA